MSSTYVGKDNNPSNPKRLFVWGLFVFSVCISAILINFRGDINPSLSVYTVVTPLIFGCALYYNVSARLKFVSTGALLLFLIISSLLNDPSIRNAVINTMGFGVGSLLTWTTISNIKQNQITLSKFNIRFIFILFLATLMSVLTYHYTTVSSRLSSITDFVYADTTLLAVVGYLGVSPALLSINLSLVFARDWKKAILTQFPIKSSLTFTALIIFTLVLFIFQYDGLLPTFGGPYLALLVLAVATLPVITLSFFFALVAPILLYIGNSMGFDISRLVTVIFICWLVLIYVIGKKLTDEETNYMEASLKDLLAPIFFTTTPTGTILSSSTAFQEIIRDNIKKTNFIDIFGNSVFRQMRNYFARYKNEGTTFQVELSFKGKQYLLVATSYIQNLKGSSNIDVILYDISSLQTERNKAQAYLTANVNTYAVYDQNWDYVHASKQFLQLMEAETMEQLPSSEFLYEPSFSKSDLDKTRDFWAKADVDTEEVYDICKIQTLSGKLISVRGRARKIRSESSDEYMILVGFEDVTKLLEQQEKLADANAFLVEQNRRDPLTGVYNRLGLNHYLAPNNKGKRERDLSLFLIDIDNFKSVNDEHTHFFGDKLLTNIAKTLQDIFSDDDIVVRIGGDEFIVCTPFHSETNAKLIAENVRQKVARTQVETNTTTISRTASVSYTTVLRSADLGTSLINLDLALRDAKNRGKNTSVLCNKTFIKDMEDRGYFITDGQIESALMNGEFGYYLQPIVNCDTNITVGYEALIRWNKSNSEILSPAKFVDALMRTFYNDKFDEIRIKMIQDALEAVSEYPERYISFNDPIDRFLSDTEVVKIINTFNTLRQKAKNDWVLEISEETMNSNANFSKLSENLQKLRTAGIKIALDDFGIEHSNFARLTSLPIDTIKLDRSLILDILTDTKKQKTVEVLIQLGKGLGIGVTIEGVEVKEEVDLIKSFGGLIYQGYYYSKPLPLSEVK